MKLTKAASVPIVPDDPLQSLGALPAGRLEKPRLGLPSTSE
ncbi:hypothetical protein [Sphingomonas sp. MMS24-J13]